MDQITAVLLIVQAHRALCLLCRATCNLVRESPIACHVAADSAPLYRRSLLDRWDGSPIQTPPLRHTLHFAKRQLPGEAAAADASEAPWAAILAFLIVMVLAIAGLVSVARGARAACRRQSWPAPDEDADEGHRVVDQLLDVREHLLDQLPGLREPLGKQGVAVHLHQVTVLEPKATLNISGTAKISLKCPPLSGLSHKVWTPRDFFISFFVDYKKA